VRVDGTARDGRLRIAVSDGGRGVPVEERERVWLPYVRLPHAQGRGGTGLGLSVVRELVLLMHGRVWVEDDDASRGARFVVELDLAAPAPAEPRTPEFAGR
jgi:signal transduction histidine kinase